MYPASQRRIDVFVGVEAFDLVSWSQKDARGTSYSQNAATICSR